MSENSENPVKLPPPVVTYLLAAGCALTFFFQASGSNNPLTDVTYPGYVDPLSLWSGRYWGLLTSFFYHGNLIHVAFNVYWLIPFGTALERHLGSLRFLLFWVLATSFGSLMQAYTEGSTGVGASGFVYALFGCLWVAGRENPDLEAVLSPGTKLLFMVWLIACMAATSSGLVMIANGSHLGGIALGALYGYVFFCQHHLIWKQAAIAFTGLAFLPLFYAPWSGYWNLAQGIKAYGKAQYQQALFYFDRVQLPPYDAFVLEYQIDAMEQAGQQQDLAIRYRRLFSQKLKMENPTRLYNGYAWLLATTPDKEINARREEEAIRYARLACNADPKPNSGYLDTLAAAYANAGQFDQAIESQNQAIACGKPEEMEELKAHLQLYQNKQPLRIAPQKLKATP